MSSSPKTTIPDHFDRWRTNAPAPVESGVPGVPGVRERENVERDRELRPANTRTPPESAGVPGVPSPTVAGPELLCRTPRTPDPRAGVPSLDYENLLKFQPVTPTRTPRTPRTPHFDRGGEEEKDRPASSPVEQLDREWAAAMARARGAFAEHGVEPSQGTLQCAAWLEMELTRGWDDSSGINKPTAREWLAEIYQGRAIGRIGEGGRPILRLARRGAAR